MSHALEPLIDGLVHPESLRWHDEALWFADLYNRKIFRVDVESRTARQVTEYPSDDMGGIGFLPDDTLIFVVSNDRRILQFDGNAVSHYADLTGLAGERISDMIVHPDGSAYVGSRLTPMVETEAQLLDQAADSGNLGSEGTDQPCAVICVTNDRTVSCGTHDIDRPNGMAVSADGKTLFAAETLAARIWSYEIGTDGQLLNRTEFGAFSAAEGAGFAVADGICLDVEGAVWVADPMGGRVVRLLPGGEIEQEVRLPNGHKPACCVLGGPDRRSLCISSASALGRASTLRAHDGQISTVRVSVPGAGWP